MVPETPPIWDMLDWDLDWTISASRCEPERHLAVCGHQSFASDDQFRELILPTIPDLVVTPSLTMMRWMKFLTVLALMFISWAICFVVRPLVSNSTASLSRGVSLCCSQERRRSSLRRERLTRTMETIALLGENSSETKMLQPYCRRPDVMNI